MRAGEAEFLDVLSLFVEPPSPLGRGKAEGANEVS